MRLETLKKLMDALTDVAGAVRRLRELLPAGSGRLDGLSEEVAGLAGEFCEDCMLGDVGSAERTGKWEDGADAALLRKAERELVHGAPYIVAEKAKGGRPKKDTPKRETVTPAGGEPEAVKARAAAKPKPAAPKAPEAGAGDKPAQVMRVCPDCGQSYLRTGNSQKRCRACGEAKTREAQAAWKAANPAKAGPEGGRIARIRAVNERMDRIPEPGGKAGPEGALP